MDPLIWQSLIAAAAAGIGGGSQWYVGRRKEKREAAQAAAKEKREAEEREAKEKREAAQATAKNDRTSENDRYEDLQQDLAAERKARIDLGTELRREIANLQMILNAVTAEKKVLEDYAGRLRQHILAGRPPPPEEWPVSLIKGVTRS